LTNATHNVAATPNSRPADFLALLQKIAPPSDTTNLRTLLDATLLAAWHAGCPQHRIQALDAAQRLPPELPAKILSIPESAIPQTLPQLRANPWLDPANPQPKTLRQA